MSKRTLVITMTAQGEGIDKASVTHQIEADSVDSALAQVIGYAQREVPNLFRAVPKRDAEQIRREQGEQISAQSLEAQGGVSKTRHRVGSLEDYNMRKEARGSIRHSTRSFGRRPRI